MDLASQPEEAIEPQARWVAPLAGAEPMGFGEYEVVAGDCITSVADAHGHFWQTLWEHPENAELKRTRQDPNVIRVGDKLHVPELEAKDENGPTEQRHRFRKLGVPAMFRVQLLRGKRPRAGLKFTLMVDVAMHQGLTDAEGLIAVPLAPGARSATLLLHTADGDERLEFDLGHTEPVETIQGVQQRLRNLGLLKEITGKVDQGMASAVSLFQRRMGIEPDGLVNDDFRKQLRDAHGS